jgi:hypothetical protein
MFLILVTCLTNPLIPIALARYSEMRSTPPPEH